MGQCIIVGTATTIYVKKEGKYSTYNLEQIKEILSKKLNLNLYDIAEDENQVYLSIKPKIFSENILSLLQNEYEILGVDINNEYNKELFEKIKHTPYNQLLNEIESKNLNTYDFQFLKGYYYISNDISYIANNSNIAICADIIAFYLGEKAFLEAYNSLFDYLRNKIIKTMDNPLKDDVFITLFG